MINKGRFSKEDRERARQAGLKGGARCRELGKGVNSFSQEKRKEVAQLALKARGKTRWTPREYGVLKVIMNDPDYKFQSGTHKGYYDHQRITEDHNYLVHDGRNVRTVVAIKRAIEYILEMEANGELTC